MNLTGKKILITGGSSGIGKATAKLLAEAGAKVMITGRNADKLAQIAEETNAIPLHANVANAADTEKTYQAVREQLGGLDALINNAGIGEFAPLGQLTLANFHEVFETNVFGLAMLTQKLLPFFVEQQHGNIINIASSAATKGFANGSVYAASKFALRGMTECWRAELRKHNIRVVLLNPSEVATAFFSNDRSEREEQPSKLRSLDIALAAKHCLEMDDRAFIPEISVWATNPIS
jgi:3-oxoacyl-[acyl-carrier protein] reductase